jgi:hypothetical protein
MPTSDKGATVCWQGCQQGAKIVWKQSDKLRYKQPFPAIFGLLSCSTDIFNFIELIYYFCFLINI